MYVETAAVACATQRFHGSGLKRRKQYLVAWEGYGREEDTWEDADSILDDDLIDDFKRRKPQAPRGHVSPPRTPGVRPCSLVSPHLVCTIK